MKNNSNKYSVKQKSPLLAIKFANIIFILTIILSVLMISKGIHVIYDMKEPTSLKLPIITIIFGFIIFIFFSVGLKKLNNDLKVNLSILIMISGISIFSLELLLSLVYDTRDRLQVVMDLNEDGIQAYPNFIPSHPLVIESNGFFFDEREIYPLGGPSEITNVHCNESGYWVTFNSDEYGFNNPKELFSENDIDIMLVGDSFSEGTCVNQDQTLSASLRRLFKNKAISLGKGGSGPLIELASIVEYAVSKQPKILLWQYCRNDLKDLKRELNSALLRKYLFEEDFKQNLMSKQNEIDTLILNFLDGEIQKEIQKRNLFKNWYNFLSIAKLRQKLGFVKKQLPNNNKNNKLEQELIIFKNILSRANNITNTWDGNFYFLYFPSKERYLYGDEYISEYYEPVLRMVAELGINIIDIHSEVFLNHPDPVSLFNRNHYNAEGYRLIAEYINNRFKLDNIISYKKG